MLASKALMVHSFLILHCNLAIFIFFCAAAVRPSPEISAKSETKQAISPVTAEPFFLILPSKYGIGTKLAISSLTAEPFF